MLSSHLVADLERVCDYLIVLVGSRVRVAGDVEELLATHHLLTGPRRDPATLPAGQQVISASHTDRQTTLLVRTSGPSSTPPGPSRGRPGRPGPGLHEPGQPPADRNQPPGGAAMIWLTWRQFRAQAVAASAALVAFAILLAVTGPHLASLYGASGLPGCHGGGCGQLASNFLVRLATGPYPFVYLLGLAGHRRRRPRSSASSGARR